MVYISEENGLVISSKGVYLLFVNGKLGRRCKMSFREFQVRFNFCRVVWNGKLGRRCKMFYRAFHARFNFFIVLWIGKLGRRCKMFFRAFTFGSILSCCLLSKLRVAFTVDMFLKLKDLLQIPNVIGLRMI